MSRESITGGCQCGAVRYRIDGALTEAHICHCRMCQKAAGNYFMPLANARRDDFHGTRGTISWFHSSDPVRRGFCSNCGTPLVFETLAEAHINVTLGSLDRPDLARPLVQYGVESRMPWFCDLPDLPAVVTAGEGDPTAKEELHAIAASNHQHPDHDTVDWKPGH